MKRSAFIDLRDWSQRSGTVAVLLCLAVMMPGCAPGGLYSWGDYPDQVYEYFGDKPIGELIDSLEAQRQRSEDRAQALPPSFYAHLALLHQKNGDSERFKALLLREKELYPESASMVDFLLKRLQ